MGSSVNLSGLTPGTQYTYTAYNNWPCSISIATASAFTTPALDASSVTATGATLTLSNYANSWWLKRTDIASQTCKSKGTDTTEDLSDLTAGATYTYKAYSDGSCNNEIASETFTTPGLTTSGVTATGATLTIAGHTGQWWYKATTGPHATCQGPVAAGTDSKDITGLTLATSYTYSAYSASGCADANRIATASAFTTGGVSVSNLSQADHTTKCGMAAGGRCALAFTTGSTAGGYTLHSIIAKLEKEQTPTGLVVSLHADNSGSPNGATLATLTGSAPTTAGNYTYACAGSGCILSPSTTYHVQFDQTTTPGAANQFVLYATTSDSETLVPAGNGWSLANQTNKGSDSAWNGTKEDYAGKVAVFAVVHPSTLTASSITATGATLTIANHTAAWWYKSDTAGATTCESVAANTGSKALSGLAPGTAYTYSAYSASGCADANRIATASAFTTGGVSVSNMGVIDASQHNVITPSARWSAEFATGGNPGGYTVHSITMPLQYGGVGSTPLVWTIRTSATNSANKAVPSDTVQATLTGSTPTETSYSNFTYTCAGDGCTLLPNTTYFLHVTSSGNSYQYWWNYKIPTSDDNYTAVPSDNGWSIGNGWYSNYSNDTWGDWATYNDVGKFRVAATANPGLTVAVSGSSATLTLHEYSGSWWLKRTDIASQTCKSMGTDTTEDLSALTASTTYIYKAYSKDGCASADEIASVTFTPVTLAAGAITSTGATLTVAGHTAQWWYKATTAPHTTCQGPVAASTASKAITGLTPLTSYTYSAYSASGCADADKIATASAFTTLGASVSNLSVTSNGDFYIGNFTDDNAWATGFTVPAGSNNYTLNNVIAKFGAKNGSPGSIAAKIYSDSSGKPGTEVTGLTLTGPTGPVSTDAVYVCSGTCELTAGNTYHLAFLVSGASHNHYYRWQRASSDSEVNTPSAGTWTIANYSSRSTDVGTSWTALQSNSHSGLFKVTAALKTGVTASSVTATTATLTVAGYTGDWWYKETAPSTSAACTAAVSGSTTADLSDLEAGTSYTFKAYSDSACATEIASETFSTPASLTASSITATTATLTIAGHTGTWYYKKTAPETGTCTTVTNSLTANLTDLTAGTSYTYKAYSNATCTTEIASETFSAAATLTAGSSPTATTNTLTIAGHTAAWWYKYTVPATPAGTCTSVAANTATANLTGLAKSTSYTFKAYSDSTCTSANELATAAAFTTTTPTLAASSVTHNSATLTLTGWAVGSGTGKDGNWYFQAGSAAPYATCSTAQTTGTASLSSLTTDTAYTFKAYSDASCGTEITTNDTDVTFTPVSGAILLRNSADDADITTLDVAENGSASYKVKLSVLPTASVTVTIGEGAGDDDDTDITVSTPSGKSLTFTTTDWNTAQTVTLAAAEDSNILSGSRAITHTASGAGSGYAGTTASLTATEVDNDKGIVLSATTLSVTENASATYTVALSVVPTGDVTVALTATGDAGITFTPSSLTFTTNNWSTAQTVTVSAATDANTTDETKTITHTASSGGYGSVSTATLTATADDDTVTLTASSITATTATLTIAGHTDAWRYKHTGNGATCSSEISAGTAAANLTGLTKSASYTFEAYSDDTCASANKIATATAFTTTTPTLAASSVTHNSATLTLTGWTVGTGTGKDGNWRFKQTTPATGTYATCSAEQTGTTASLSSLTTDTAYTFKAYSDNSCNTEITTNDTDANFTPTSGAILLRNSADDADITTLDVAEGGSASYKVKLSVLPTASVTVTIGEGAGDDDDTDITVSTPSGKSLTFTTTDWNTAQTVTLAAAEDSNILSGSRAITHTASGAGSGYAGTTASLTATEVDNDKGIVLSATTLSVTENASATYTVALSVVPTGDVTVALTATGDSDITFTPSSLTFTTTNWSTAQTVTVSAATDADTTDETKTITHTASNGGYGSVSTATLTATADDITVGLTVTATATTATLTLDNYSGSSWHYKETAPSTGTCSSAQTGATANLTGLDKNTDYTYKAYSDTTCTTELATASFSTTNPELTSSNVAITTATLTLSGWTAGTGTGKDGNWRYKADTGPDSSCSAAQSTGTVNLTGLTKDTQYTYTAYSDNNCTTVIDAAPAFTTVSAKRLTASSVTTTTATLTLTGHTGAWRYKYTTPSGGTCSSEIASGTTTASLTSLDPGTTYTFTAYSDNNCTVAIVTAADFTTLSNLAASSITATSATLTVSNHTGNWYYKQTSPIAGTCTLVSNSTTASLTTLTAGTSYTYKAYSDSSCNTQITAAVADFTTPASLTAGTPTATTNTLAIAGHTGDWYYKYTAPATPAGTCSSAVTAGTSSVNLTNLTEGTTYTFKAYSDSECTTELATAADFTTLASLTASNVRAATATLTLAGHSGAWRYKYTAPATPAGTCSSEIGSGTSTASPTALTAGTTYTFKAYSDNSCNTEISGASVTFTTPKLEVTELKASTAKLTLTDWAPAWWYKHTTPPNGTCTAVAKGTSEVSLTSLVVGTTYIYKAYSDDTCATLIATAGSVTTTSGGITLSHTAVNVTEGSTAVYTVKLSVAPTASVTVSIAEGTGADEDADITVSNPSSKSLTFTTDNWSTAQTVTLAAAEDSDSITGSREINHTASNGGYNGVTAKLTATEVENDKGIILKDSSLQPTTGISVTEGGSANYFVRLSVQPSATVTVTLAGTGDDDITFDTDTGTEGNQNTLTFSTTDYSTDKQVRVSAAADTDFAHGTKPITHTPSGSDSGYNTAVTLTATEVDTTEGLTTGTATATTNTLTIHNHTAAWWYKSTTTGKTTCTAVAANTASVNLTGLTQNTSYTFTAYSDSTCATELATATAFSTTNPALTASNATGSSATITLSNWAVGAGAGKDGNWYYKAATGPHTTCSAAQTGTTVNLTGLTDTTTYAYTAYSNSNCSTAIVTGTVKTLDAVLSVTAIEHYAATLNISNYTGTAWYHKRVHGPANATCTTVGSGTTSNLNNLTGDTFYGYTLYRNSGCTTPLHTAYFSTTDVGASSLGAPSVVSAVGNSNGVKIKRAPTFTTGTTTHGYTLTSVTLRFDAKTGNPGNISVALHEAKTNNTAPADAAHAVLSGDNTPDTAGLYTYTCSTNCDLGSSKKYYIVVSAPSAPSGSWYKLHQGANDATVDEVRHPSGNGWVIHDKMWFDFGGTTGEAGNPSIIHVAADEKATLTASAVTTTGATLNITEHSGKWYYKRTAGPADSTCTTVSRGVFTDTLSSLTTDRFYEYTAYRDNACSDALDSTHFSTTIAGVNNLKESATGVHVGDSGGAKTKLATEFTTGSEPKGYLLSRIALDFDAESGSPGSITVALHAADTANSSNPAATAQATLSGSNPDTAGLYTYTCSTGCGMERDSDYFIVVSAPSAATGAGYHPHMTDGDAEIKHPSTNGWSIENTGRKHNGTSWGATSGSRVLSMHLAANLRTPALAGGTTPTATTNTLTITNWADAWHYKSTTTGKTTCSSAVAAGTSTANITGMTQNTSYTFSAYSDSGCTAAKLLATAAAFTTANPSLASSNVLTDTATLTISGWAAGTGTGKDGNWHYKADKAPHNASCSAAQTTATASLTGLTGSETYTYTAYSDATCTKTIAAAAAFTTQPPYITATSITSTGATLNITGHPTAWYYKRTHGPADTTCTTVAANTSSHTLSATLSADTLYGYTAYSASGCASANTIDTVYFSTTDVGVGSLGAPSVVSAVGNSNGVKIKRAPTFTTGAATHGYTLTSVTLRFDAKTGNPGNISVALHEAKTNNTAPADAAHAVLSGDNTPDTAGLYTYTCATNCVLDDGKKYYIVVSAPSAPSGSWYKLHQGANDATVDEVRHPSGNGWVIHDKMWFDFGGTAGEAGNPSIIHVAANINIATLSAPTVSGATANLEIIYHTGAWYFKRTAGGVTDATCHTVASASDGGDVRGLADSTTYTYTAYSDSSCTTANALDSVQFTTGTGKPTTNIDTVGSTTATLSIDNVTGPWYYKRVHGPSDSTCRSVSTGAGKVNLTGLTANTLYGYRAYDDSGCANTLESAVYFTTSKGTGAGNLGYGSNGSFYVGNAFDNKYEITASFGTGPSGKGYTLGSITISFNNIVGSPGDIRATLHEGSVTASAQATLGGGNPSGSGWHTFTCTGSQTNNCALKKSTTYHVLLTAPNSSGRNNRYNMPLVLEDDDYHWPDGGGWSIGNAGSYKRDGNNWTGFSGGRTIFLHVAADIVPLPVLTVSNITSNGATITLTNYTGSWWYKSTTGGKEHCTAAPADTYSVTFTDLNANTGYIFSAYSNSTCRNWEATAGRFDTPSS